MHKSIALAVGTVLLGCNPVPPTHYQVFISPRFSIDHQRTIQSSIDEWKEVVPELSFDISTMEVATPRRDQISITPVPGPGECTRISGTPCWGYHYKNDFNGHKIILSVDRSPRDFSELTLHELGHAFLILHLGDHTLMYPFIGDKSARHITCKDVAAFWALRGQHPLNCL